MASDEDIPFLIKAIPQGHLTQFSESNTDKPTPINIKIKIQNLQENLIRNGIISLPQPGSSRSKKVRLVKSNQTIMSFDMLMEPDFNKSVKRDKKNIFKLFMPGGCLSSRNDVDRCPYTPSSSDVPKHEKKITINNKTDSGRKRDLSLSKYYDSADSNYELKTPIFLGKCKPGGCLDPPFVGENYPYMPSIKSPLRLRSQSVTTYEDNNSIEQDKSIDVVVNTNLEHKATEEENIVADNQYQNTFNNNVIKKYSDILITYPHTLSSSELKSHQKKGEKKSKDIVNSNEMPRLSQNEFKEGFYSPKLSNAKKSLDIKGKYFLRTGESQSPRHSKNILFNDWSNAEEKLNIQDTETMNSIQTYIKNSKNSTEHIVKLSSTPIEKISSNKQMKIKISEDYNNIGIISTTESLDSQNDIRSTTKDDAIEETYIPSSIDTNIRDFDKSIWRTSEHSLIEIAEATAQGFASKLYRKYSNDNTNVDELDDQLIDDSNSPYYKKVSNETRTTKEPQDKRSSLFKPLSATPVEKIHSFIEVAEATAQGFASKLYRKYSIDNTSVDELDDQLIDDSNSPYYKKVSNETRTTKEEPQEKRSSLFKSLSATSVDKEMKFNENNLITKLKYLKKLESGTPTVRTNTTNDLALNSPDLQRDIKPTSPNKTMAKQDHDSFDNFLRNNDNVEKYIQMSLNKNQSSFDVKITQENSNMIMPLSQENKTYDLNHHDKYKISEPSMILSTKALITDISNLEQKPEIMYNPLNLPQYTTETPELLNVIEDFIVSDNISRKSTNFFANYQKESIADTNVPEYDNTVRSNIQSRNIFDTSEVDLTNAVNLTPDRKYVEDENKQSNSINAVETPFHLSVHTDDNTNRKKNSQILLKKVDSDANITSLQIKSQSTGVLNFDQTESSKIDTWHEIDQNYDSNENIKLQKNNNILDRIDHSNKTEQHSKRSTKELFVIDLDQTPVKAYKTSSDILLINNKFPTAETNTNLDEPKQNKFNISSTNISLDISELNKNEFLETSKLHSGVIKNRDSILIAKNIIPDRKLSNKHMYNSHDTSNRNSWQKNYFKESDKESLLQTDYSKKEKMFNKHLENPLHMNNENLLNDLRDSQVIIDDNDFNREVITVDTFNKLPLNKLKNKYNETLLEDSNNILLNFAFQTYVSDAKDMAINTLSPLAEVQQSNEYNVTTIKTNAKIGEKMTVPVDSKIDLNIEITRTQHLETGKFKSSREYFGIKADTNAELKKEDISNDTLKLLYDSNLLPTKNVIKKLRNDIRNLNNLQDALKIRIKNNKKKYKVGLLVKKRCECVRN